MSSMTIFLFHDQSKVRDHCTVIVSDEKQPIGVGPKMARVHGRKQHTLDQLANAVIGYFKKNLPKGSDPMSPITRVIRYSFDHNGKMTTEKYRTNHAVSTKPA